MKKVFLKSTLLLCALIVGSLNVWGVTKPWSGSDPASTLDLKTITSSTMGTWNGTTSWYLCDDTLIVSGYESKMSVSNQTWITQASVGNSSTSWDASSPFKGSSYYTNGSYATIQSGRYLLYKVTNLKSLEIYGKNNSTTNYLDIFIYKKAGDNDYTQIEEIKYTTDNKVHVWKNSTTLSPSDTYYIYITGVGGSNSRVFEVAFERNVAVKHTLSSAVSPSGVGTVTLGATSVGEGSSTSISAAVTNADYRFKNWTKTSGTITDVNAASTSFTMGTADATVTANFELIPTHTLTVTAPSGGTITVKSGDDEIASGSSVKEGTVLTITAAAGANKEFASWSVTGATPASTTSAETTFTVGESDVTIAASFNDATTYQIQWSVNGSIVKTENVVENNAITFAAPASGIPVGMVYKGWVSSPIDGTQNTAPTYVTEAKSTTDITYYCVMAVETGEEGTAKLTASHTSAATTYAEHSYTDDKGNTWNAYCNEATDNSCTRFGLKNQASPAVYLESPTFPGNVTDIKIQIYNGSSSNRTYYINSACGKTGDYGTAEGTKSTKLTAVKTATLTKTFNKFFLQASDALGVGYISVSYSSISTSHYCTTAPSHIITPTPDKYYSTFYAPYNIQLPTEDNSHNEITVTAYIGVRNESTLKLYPFDGTVVPKETAVILKSTNANAFNLTATATAASALADNDDDVTVSSNSLIGTSEETDASKISKAYVLGYNASPLQASGFYMKSTGNIPANKAYLVIAPTEAPAVIRFEEEENNATDILTFESTDKAVKFFENGQLLIKRDGIVYDALGRIVR